MGREISSLRIRRLLRLLVYLRKRGVAGAEVSDILRLDMNELGALSMGLGMAMHFIPFIKGSCKRLWQKISDIVPQSMLELGELLASAVTMEVPVSGIKPLIFEIILEAVLEHNVLEIWYVKGGELRHNIRLKIREPMATIVSETHGLCVI